MIAATKASDRLDVEELRGFDRQDAAKYLQGAIAALRTARGKVGEAAYGAGTDLPREEAMIDLCIALGKSQDEVPGGFARIQSDVRGAEAAESFRALLREALEKERRRESAREEPEPVKE